MTEPLSVAASVAGLISWSRFSLVSLLWKDILLRGLGFRSNLWNLLQKASTARRTSLEYIFGEAIAGGFGSFLRLSTMIYTMGLAHSRLRRLLAMRSKRIVR